MCGSSPPLATKPPPPLPNPEEGALKVSPNQEARPESLQASLQQAALSTLQIPLRR